MEHGDRGINRRTEVRGMLDIGGCRGELPRRASDRVARLWALRETSALVLAHGPLVGALPALADRLARVCRGGCLIRPTREAPTAFGLAYGHARSPARTALGDLVNANPDALLSAYSARVAQTGEAAFTPVVSARVLHLWTQPAGWAYLDSFDVCSVLAVPIHRLGQVLGTLLIWREQPSQALTRAHQTFIDQFAGRLSSVLPAGVQALQDQRPAPRAPSDRRADWSTRVWQP